MRGAAFLFGVVAALGASACSDPDCRPGETKIGLVCYPERSADDTDATVESSTKADTSIQSNVVSDAASPTDKDASRPAVSADASEVRPSASVQFDGSSSTSDASTDALVVPDGGASVATSDASCPAGTVADGSACAPTCDAVTESCDQKDNDCDGMIDEGNVCAPACVPTAELCDRKDNDCDGMIDEEPPTWYRDCDNDGAAVLAGSVQACAKPTEAGCTNWLSTAPITTDCKDDAPRYRPGIEPAVTTNAPNATEEAKYLGDMNCDGQVEKPAQWQYYDWDTGKWTDANFALCNGQDCDTGGAPCYDNLDSIGSPLDCGNTEIQINYLASCWTHAVTARVICR